MGIGQTTSESRSHKNRSQWLTIGFGTGIHSKITVPIIRVGEIIAHLHHMDKSRTLKEEKVDVNLGTTVG